MQFKLSEYANFVSGLLTDGYSCLPFSSEKARDLDQKHLLLRHDVDIDPVAALPMAHEEHRIGARATYFILLSNRHTNPLDVEFRTAVQKLSNLGHWIGLHFDASQYGLTAESPDFAHFVRQETDLMVALTGKAPDSVSFHRPARDLIGAPRELTYPLSHTYESTFVRDIEYCSDSSGRWSYGPPTEREAVRSGLPFHFLTHPISWGVGDEEPTERIRQWMLHRVRTDYHYEIPHLENPFGESP